MKPEKTLAIAQIRGQKAMYRMQMRIALCGFNST